MNLLLPLLLFVLLGSDRAENIKNLLANIDYESFRPIFRLLKFDDKTIDFICSEEFVGLLSGKPDLASLVKLLLPADKNEDEKKKSAPEKPETEFVKADEGLSPVKDLAPDEIAESLGAFFG